MTLLDEFVKPWPKGPMSGEFIIDRGAQPTAPQVEGLLAWWTLAGVDQPVCEQPVDWMRPPAVPHAAPEQPSSAAASE